MVRLKRLDPEKADRGVLVPYKPQPEITLRLARMNNPVMARWLRDRGPERLRALRADGKSSEEARDFVFMEAVANTVVLGWEGLDDQSGQPERCTPETVLAYLADDYRPEFREFVYAAAAENGRYEEAQREAEAKNSGPA
ncbi:MAG TPA: hypothetical protein VFD43_03970 [Planctomycetota bacterium]|nr:hypothetical protein [Planctomycetota bacterium]